MLKRVALGVAICTILLNQTVSVNAQDRKSADASIDTMRTLPTISQNDQQRIRNWIALVVGELASAPANEREKAGKTFRATFLSQLNHSGNGQAFRSQFITQTAAVAAAHFADSNDDPTVSMWLARVLLDMNAPESVAGLIAGLTSKVDATRYLCARGLILQQRAISPDNAQLPKVIKALRDAGVVETSPIVLSRIYRALAFPGQAAAVLDSYLKILDRRLSDRRALNTADGAEIEAFLYFSDAGTFNALNPAQKTQLIGRIAVFFRLDAARFNNPGLGFVEIDTLERLLVEEEAIFKIATNAKDGGDIARMLDQQGRFAMDQIPAEAAKWVGNAEAKSKGVLNAAPWNVPVGAP